MISERITMLGNDFINKNLTVIIRTVGERTTELCYELVKKQIAEENIHIISETPFTEAVRKTFEVGMRENRKWTFVVDADVLLKPTVIEKLVCHAETLDEYVFEIEARIIDKFLFSPREAGNHLYRTVLMEQALKYIPEPYSEIRPETYVKDAMKKDGFSWIVMENIVGIHDYEQYYTDIYRKSFIQAKKHFEQVSGILSDWKEKSIQDKDFLVALYGFEDGCNFKDIIAIDASLNSIFKDRLVELNISEKKPGGIEIKAYSGFLMSTDEYITHKKTRKARVVVYTAISGNFDDLIQHTYISKDFNYVCFTDQQVGDPGIWEIRPLEDRNLDRVRSAKYYKILPDQFFEDYEYSVWIDGNIDVLTNELEVRIEELIQAGSILSASKHFERDCIYQEANICMLYGIDDPDIIDAQVHYYRSKGFPEHDGLFEMNIIFRKHNDQHLTAMMQDWWEMIVKFSRRDQLSFIYVLRKHGITCEHMFPTNPRQIKSFLFKPHNRVIYASISIDSGAGFNDNDLIYKKVYITEGGHFNIYFPIDNSINARAIKFRPAHNLFTRCRIEEVQADGASKGISCNNTLANSDGWGCFYTKDSIYHLEGNFSETTFLSIKGEIQIMNNYEIAQYIRQIQAELNDIHSSDAWRLFLMVKNILYKTGLHYPIKWLLNMFKVCKNYRFKSFK